MRFSTASATTPNLSNVPVVVFTGRELSAEEDAELHTIARSIVVKGVESPERLLDETSLFLHRVITELPIEKQRMLEKLNSSDEDLIGKTALLVDDDARNIFALSSVLERRGMKVLTATTGSEAVALVESSPEIAIVLMDIMMPQMDGYQTIGVIRQNPSFSRLPIIALTAKAMKGDREKCLEAGASDYLAKPVNTEQLLARHSHVASPLTGRSDGGSRSKGKYPSGRRSAGKAARLRGDPEGPWRKSRQGRLRDARRWNICSRMKSPSSWSTSACRSSTVSSSPP